MISIDAPTAGYAVARAVHFGACLLLCGVFIFDRFIVAPLGEGARAFVEQRWFSAARAMVIGCLPLSAVSGAAWLLCVTMTFLDLPARDALRIQSLQTVLDQSQFGTLWKWRGGLWLLICAISIIAFSIRRRTFSSASAAWIALIASGAFAVTLARAGHGGEGTRIHQTADAAHLLLGAAWPIGLVPLIVLLIRLPRANMPGQAMALIPILDRFSGMSLTTVLFIGVSGVVNSWPLIGRWSNLISTPYGQTLMVKVSLFLAMVFVGAINLLRVRPRLARAMEYGAEPEASRALDRLRWNVGIEILLGIGVLLAAGLLGVLPPASETCCSVIGK